MAEFINYFSYQERGGCFTCIFTHRNYFDEVLLLCYSAFDLDHNFYHEGQEV